MNDCVRYLRETENLNIHSDLYKTLIISWVVPERLMTFYNMVPYVADNDTVNNDAPLKLIPRISREIGGS